MSGVSGFEASLTALMNARRPSSSTTRAARPGEKPLGCVVDWITAEPNRSSSAARSSAGRSSQWTRTPSAGTELEKDTSPQLQVFVDPPLDGVSHVIRKRHHLVLILGRVRGQVRDLNGWMELDAPLARQRDHAERSEPGPKRGEREVRQAEE